MCIDFLVLPRKEKKEQFLFYYMIQCQHILTQMQHSNTIVTLENLHLLVLIKLCEQIKIQQHKEEKS